MLLSHFPLEAFPDFKRIRISPAIYQIKRAGKQFVVTATTVSVTLFVRADAWWASRGGSSDGRNAREGGRGGRGV